MLTRYVEEAVYCTFVTSENEFKHLTDHYLGAREDWIPYYPEKYKNVFVVDADEILIIRDHVQDCILAARSTSRDMLLGRYINMLQGEYPEEKALTTPFSTWSADILDPFYNLLEQPGQWGTLHFD